MAEINSPKTPPITQITQITQIAISAHINYNTGRGDALSPRSATLLLLYQAAGRLCLDFQSSALGPIAGGDHGSHFNDGCGRKAAR